MRLVIHINGMPGVGKLTIGRHVAQRLGARLLDNHTLLNPAEAVFARSDPLYWPLRIGIRALVLDHLARWPAPTTLVFTDALADIASDRERFEEIRALAKARDAQLVAVVLECAAEENERRLVAPGRREQHKLTRVDVLGSLLSDGIPLLRAENARLITLDVTRLSAVAAADEIVRLIGIPAGRQGIESGRSALSATRE